MTLHPMVPIWKDAIEKGGFLTPKHAPESTGLLYPRFRSITTTDASGLYQFFVGGQYSIQQYRNTDEPATPDYFVIRPNDPTFVPGSGVPAASMIPSHALNLFVVISGIKQGWHVHASDDADIERRVRKGSLVKVSL